MAHPALDATSNEPPPRSWAGLAWAVLGIGALLRVRAYLGGGSLWGDELALAINLQGLPHDARLASWVSNQPVPVGFREATRAVIALVGDSDAALRLLPLLAALASLLVFGWLVSLEHARWGRLVPLVAFAACPPLVRYAAEFKPYSLDVLVSCGILGLTVAARSSVAARRALVPAGILAPLLSFPGVFVLAASAALQLLEARRSRDRSLRLAIGVAVAWALGWASIYFLTARAAAGSPWLLAFWRARPAFWPLGSAPAALRWPVERLVALADDPGGFGPVALVAAVLLAIGAVRLARRGDDLCVLVLGPLVLAMLASAVEKYPVYGRLMLFFVPMMMLLLGAGCAALLAGSPPVWRRVAAVVTAALVLTPLVGASARLLFHPEPISDAAPVLAQVKSRWQEGDVLLVFPYALPALTYYGPRLGLDPAAAVIALRRPGAPRPYEESVAALPAGRRVFFFTARVPDMDFAREDADIREALGARGRETETFHAAGSAAYLYELADHPALPRAQ